MRPQDKPSRKQSISRVRVLLKKHAGWLPGFPISVRAGAVEWQALRWGPFGETQTYSIQRETIRSFEATLTKLRYHFPVALPAVVGPTSDWLQRMDGLLEFLKAAVHADDPVTDPSTSAAPPSAALDATTLKAWGVKPRWIARRQQLMAAQPTLRPLVEAVTFLECTASREWDSGPLEWIEERAPALADVARHSDGSTSLLLMICDLRDELPAGFQEALLSLFANPIAGTTPLQPTDYLERLHGQAKRATNGTPFQLLDPPDRPTIFDVWVQCLTSLHTVEPKVRRRGALLTGLLFPHDLIAQIVDRAARDAQMEAQLLQWLRRAHARPSARSAPLATPDPLQLPVARALAAALKVAETDARTQEWMRLLRALGELDPASRVRLFARWQKLIQRHWNQRQGQKLRKIIRPLTTMIERRGLHPTLHGHWADAGDRDHVLQAFFSWEFHKRSERWVKLFEKVVYDRGASLDRECADLLDSFAEAKIDNDQGADVAAILLATSDGNYVAVEEVQTAFALATSDAQTAQLLRVWSDDSALLWVAELTAKHIRDQRLRSVVEEWSADDKKRPLRRFGSALRLVIDCAGTLPAAPPPRPEPGWPERYPEPLHAALNELDAATANAESIAAKILSRDFPAPEMVRREMTSLQGILAREHTDAPRAKLERRIENLRQQLDSPRAATPGRLQTLARKISMRATHELVEDFVQRCQAEARRCLQEILAVPAVPEPLFESPFDVLLSAVLRLNGKMKQLGLRLLVEAQRAEGHDFSNAPENVEFLRRIAAQGVVVEPWLSESFESVVEGADGESYRLHFARDIVDILQMGLHFDTCLSPHSFNFYSTIANAVDVNKQVVYGKTNTGRVIGRCLFALSSQGTLLTYHQYAHNEADGFRVAVHDFADRLAAEMRVVRVSRGEVPPLVAQKWYDDGACLEGSIFDMQAEDGAVRSLLRNATPATLVEQLQALFPSAAGLRTVLGELLAVPEFTSHPGIVQPLVSFFAPDTTLPFGQQLRLAVLAHSVGDLATAMTIVRNLGPSRLPQRLKRMRDPWQTDFPQVGTFREVLCLLCEFSPTIALRLIRSTRAPKVRADSDEVDPERQELLRMCLAALGRGQGQ